jgi:GGDEF domain-containing protein
VSERYQAREQLDTLERGITAAIVSLLTLLEAFHLAVAHVPAMHCLLEGLVIASPGVALFRFALSVSDRLLTGGRESFLCDSLGLLVTASLGIAVRPDDGRECGIMVKHANTAMYCLKDEGRDGWQRYSSAPERQTAS